MAEVQGNRGTGQLGTESRAVRDVSPAMRMLQPSEGPLTSIMMKLNAKPADNADFEWYEDDLVPHFDTLGGALTTGATTMTVTNYKRFRLGHLVKINRREIVRVTATPSSTTVSIQRAFGTTAALAASSADQLHIIGTAFEEGSAKAAIITTTKVQKTNYAEIFKTAWGVTNTNKHTKQYGGSDAVKEKANKLLEHKRDIEFALWHGEAKKDTTTGTHPIRETKGILSFISTNAVDAGGELTEEEWEDWLRRCFRFGSDEKMVFCAPKVIGVVNSFARGKLQTVSGDQKYGVSITRYENAGRKVLLVENKQFSNESLSDLDGIAGMAVCLDMGDLALRYMRGKIVGEQLDIETPGDDLEQGQYVSELGLEMSLEKKHGILTGVTS